MTKVDEPVSLSDYAKHRGCSKQAVSKAVETGRLLRSIVRVDGKPKIADVALADQEWERRLVKPPKRSLSSSSRPTEDEPGPPDQPAAPPHAGSEAARPVDLFEAQRLSTLELARTRRLANDEREGRLIAVDRVAKEAFEAERIVRETVLNLPARIAGALAAETDPARIYSTLDAELRAALRAAADALMDNAREGGPDAAA